MKPMKQDSLCHHGDFTFAFRRALFVFSFSLTLLFLTPAFVQATSGTFTAASGTKSWSAASTANWSGVAGGGTIPGGTSGDVCDFSTVDVTAARTVSMVSFARTLGTLKVGDAGA